MAARCVVLKNHMKRSTDYRIKYSMRPHFVKIRCTNWQVAVGVHHQFAIDHVKFMIEEDEDNPNDFDYVSFDYYEGQFIDHLFSTKEALEIWDKADLMDIIHLGPDSPEDDTEGNFEADQYPDPNKGKVEG